MVCNGIISSNMSFLTVKYSQNWGKAPVVGDIVSTTTSRLDYCSMSHQFTNCDSYAEMFVFFDSDDYSEYDERFCNDGGKYGYDFYIVASVVFIEETEDIELIDYVEDANYVVSCDIDGFDFDIDEIEELEELLSL